MSGKTEIFGNYREMNPDHEYITLRFRAAEMNLDELWESGALSASFLSGLWEKFFPSRDIKSKAAMKNGVRYIAGELIGNALKYCYKSDFLIRTSLYLFDKNLYFQVTNILRLEDAAAYREFIREIMDNDPNEIYIKQMEKNALEGCAESRIGFLTMILDYGAEPSWKFNTEDDTGSQTVITMLRIPMERNA